MCKGREATRRARTQLGYCEINSMGKFQAVMMVWLGLLVLWIWERKLMVALRGVRLVAVGGRREEEISSWIVEDTVCW